MMSNDVDNTSDHRARLVVVERGLVELKETVGDLAKNVNRWIQQQSQAPRPIPLKEIVTTAAATIAIFGGIVTFLDNRAETQTKLLQYRIEQLEKKKAEAPQLQAQPSIMMVPVRPN